MKEVPSTIDKFISEIDCEYPDLLRSPDLLNLGLYKTSVALYQAMHQGLSPPFIRLSPRKTFFPKSMLCEWLKEKSKSGEE